MFLPAAAAAQEANVEDVQYLTRGPVHEAFAESVSFDPVAGIIITGQVPEPIEEIPPDQQPEGDNVTWISGYWAWDDDQSDFIWISGIWRNLPPGRQWVPGYWSEIDGGQSQWTSGYWADSTEETVSYIETVPPRNIDEGPNIEAPSAEHSWIPGNWMWNESRYAWRPGYWVPQRENWNWVPSRYNWTRRGYVHVDGYWDHAIARRGVLFAPVSYRNGYYRTPNYIYTPSIVVALNVFSDHLFVRPRSSHYYFGDYYAPRYRDAGIFASFSWHSGRRGYDPIYAYDRWHHRGDRSWERSREDNYNYFRDHEDARPAHTWAAMRDYRSDRFNDGRNRTYAATLDGYAKDSKTGQRFSKLDEGRRKQYVTQRQEMRTFGQERRQLETRARVAGDAPKQTVAREKLSRRSPVVGREAERFAKNEAPPKRPEARGSQNRAVPAKNGKQEPGDTAKRPDADKDRNPAGRPENRPGNRQPDDKAVKPGMDRDDKATKPDRPGQRRDAEPSKEAPGRKAQDREAPPKQQTRPNPERKTPAEPKRETKPQPRETPRREAAPKAKPSPAPKQAEPKREVTPKREAQPKPEVRKAPAREARPQPKANPEPSRRPEASPRREAKPAQEARPSPKRESRPQPQTRPSPAPKAAPQRKAPETRKERSKTEEESLETKGKRSKE